MNLVFNVSLSFQLSQSFHTDPSVFLVLGQQQRGDSRVELGHLDSVPGSNEYNIWTKESTMRPFIIRMLKNKILKF